jgi:hypothetical protein
MKRFALVLTLAVVLIFSQGVCQRSVAELISVHLDGKVDIDWSGPFSNGDLFSGYFTFDPAQPSGNGKYEALSLGFSIGDYSWSLLTCKKGEIAILNMGDHDLLSVRAGNYDKMDSLLDGPFTEGMKYSFVFTSNDDKHSIPNNPSDLETQNIHFGFSSDLTQNLDPATNAEGLGKIIAAGPATPSEFAKHLINTVICLMLPKNVENSYLANLKKVPTFIDTGKNIAAINQVTAFIQKVQQDIGHGFINEVDGTDLIDMANQLIGKIQG